MELTTLKNYVERELGHPVEQADLEERFVWLIQDYHSMKGELTREDLTYIFETDMEIFENLGFLVDHYEVHLMSGPGIEYEVEDSYDFFNYKEAKEAFERFGKSGYWVRLISVDSEGVFNDQTDEDNFNKNQEVIKMNNRYYQALLENKFSPEFVADLEELCDKHNISDASLITKMHDLLQGEYDKEDITIWLENDSCYPSLAENGEFVEYLAYMYRKLSDSNYGTWDNIETAFTRVKDELEWKEIVDAAYVEE